MQDSAGHDDGFCHQALLYAGAEGFLAGTLPFIADAIAREEPVLVAVSGEKTALLESKLDGAAERVRFVNMERLGRNPACIIPACREFVAEHVSEVRGVRGIGEPVWPGRSPAELAECRQHESLLNLAFYAGPTWQLLCPYDVTKLDPATVRAARCTHPLVAENGTRTASATYRGRALGSVPLGGALPPPPAQPAELRFTVEELCELRAFVAQHAHGAGLSPQRSSDMTLAASELATNSVRHGGGSGTLRVWTEHDALLCEVSDRGHIDEPLAGRVRPNGGQHVGRGLWVVNQLCDLVQVRSMPTGTVVRIHMRPAHA
jgi:anti-sigma regulatory factor (Ser/Thr protein kinase)